MTTGSFFHLSELSPACFSEKKEDKKKKKYIVTQNLLFKAPWPFVFVCCLGIVVLGCLNTQEK
jgi:hypothetical protein